MRTKCPNNSYQGTTHQDVIVSLFSTTGASKRETCNWCPYGRTKPFNGMHSLLRATLLALFTFPSWPILECSQKSSPNPLKPRPYTTTTTTLYWFKKVVVVYREYPVPLNLALYVWQPVTHRITCIYMSSPHERVEYPPPPIKP